MHSSSSSSSGGSAFLTSLALHPSDVEQRTPISARPQLITRTWCPKKEVSDVLTTNEREKLGALVHECKYDETVVLSNFDAKLGRFMSPTGYVALMHEETTFRMDMIDRHLFRGIAVADITRKHRFTDEEQRTSLMRMNQMIRDVSPLPAKWNSAPNEWVCSLGPFGWIGIYEKRTTDQRPQLTYSILVVSCMDDGTYEDFYTKMSTEHHNKTSVREAIPTMARYRSFTQQNRGRLLAFAQQVFGEQSACTIASPEPAYLHTPTSESTIPNSVFEWLPPAPFRIPIWYSLPARTPRDCPVPLPAQMNSYPLGMKFTQEEIQLRAETMPVRILPEFDFLLDDFLPYTSSLPSQVVRYAGCCNGTLMTVTLRGGLHSITVIRSAQGDKPSVFRAHPSQMAVKAHDAKPLGVDCTWEDPDIETNRMATASFGTQLLETSETATTTTYHPLFVRLSCKDENGWVNEPSQRKRMSGFCSDLWVPL